MSKKENKVATATIAEGVNFEGLETVAVVTENNEVVNINFLNREWLENNAPDFIEEHTSSKYNPEREVKVQFGLAEVKELLGDKINPLVLLLAKWWEIKPARAAIKKMIDAEAASKNIPEDHYLQINLRENVDRLASLSQATDRLKYSINYFKPRAGLDAKEVFQVMNIKGKPYNVSLNKLNEAKAKYAEDKAALQDYMLSISTPVTTIDEL